MSRLIAWCSSSRYRHSLPPTIIGATHLMPLTEPDTTMFEYQYDGSIETIATAPHLILQRDNEEMAPPRVRRARRWLVPPRAPGLPVPDGLRLLFSLSFDILGQETRGRAIFSFGAKAARKRTMTIIMTRFSTGRRQCMPPARRELYRRRHSSRYVVQRACHFHGYYAKARP